MHHPKSKAHFRNEIVKGYEYKEESATQAIISLEPICGRR